MFHLHKYFAILLFIVIIATNNLRNVECRSLKRVRKDDIFSRLFNNLQHGQGTLVGNTNGVKIGPASNGQDLGLNFGKSVGAFQGTGLDTGYSDGTKVNAGLANPGFSSGFGIDGLGLPLFNYGKGGNLDLQNGKFFAGTDIGAGSIIPHIYQEGTSVDFGGIGAGISQMFSGAGNTLSNSKIWNPR